MKPRMLRLLIAIALAPTLTPAMSKTQESTEAANASPSAATPQSAKTRSDGIQTVVVTAQKRPEDASKVPISITVLGGDELAAQHIGDYADITRSIPNISFSGGGSGGNAGDGPGLSNIEIRGISSSAGSATVGVYMDDVSMNVANLYSMGSAEPKFFDLDHIEVLRGPQGTLYGASSMGGTIKFVTNQPDLKQQSTDFYTEFSSIKGGQGSYEANVVFNEPLIKNELALRLGIQNGHQGGYINQINQSGDIVNYGINWQSDTVIHFALKWAPTKDLTITPNIFYQKVKTGDTDVSYSQILNNGQPLDTPIYLPAYQTSKITREPGTDELLVPSLTINYDTTAGAITSVTSMFDRKFTRAQDGGQTNSYTTGQVYDPVSGNGVIVNGALASTVAALPSALTLNNKVKQLSQEIRIASKPYEAGGSPFTWITGAYFANEHTDIAENDPIYGINDAFSAAGVSPTDPNAFSPYWPATGFPGDSVFIGNYRYHDAQQSVFGELSYYLQPTLQLTMGLRYLRAQQDYSSQQYGFYQGTSYSPYITNSTSATKTTPKFSVIWEMSPNNSVFATVQEGFRMGGANASLPNACFNSNASSGVTPEPPYTPDSIWSYEVGNKSKFWDNKLTVNASLFYIKWKNIQQDIMLPCAFDYNTNVGSATSSGAELELKVKPVSNLLVDLAAGYTHATLDSDSGAESGVVGAVAGASIPGVPKFNVALSGTYSYDMTDTFLGFVRAAARWTGASYGGFAQLPDLAGTIVPPNISPGSDNPDFNRPGYHTVDLSTGVSRGDWEATIFIKNLANNNMVIQRPIVESTSGEVYRLTPRSVGISLSGKF